MSAIRATLNIVLVAILTLAGSIAALVVRIFDASGDRVLRLARWWSQAILSLGGVRIRLQSRGALDLSAPHVFMANHTSTLDIWALLVALPIPVRMIAKKQLAAIPLFGWAMWAGRFIFIDRQNPAKARRSMERAKDRIRAGASVLLFPEGTRSRDGKLGPFKKGGFHLAIDAGVPIVPVALRGARVLMPRGSLRLWPGEIDVIVGAPIPTAGLSPSHRDALLAQVHGVIDEMSRDDEPVPALSMPQ